MALIFTPGLVRHLLGPLGLSGLMTNTLGYMEPPNSRVGSCNTPPAVYPPPLPNSVPSHHPTRLYVQSGILQQLWKSCSKSSSASYIATIDSYETPAKSLLLLYSKSSMAIYLAWENHDSFKIVLIIWNVNCDNMVCFQNQITHT